MHSPSINDTKSKADTNVGRCPLCLTVAWGGWPNQIWQSITFCARTWGQSLVVGAKSGKCAVGCKKVLCQIIFRPSLPLMLSQICAVKGWSGLMFDDEGVPLNLNTPVPMCTIKHKTPTSTQGAIIVRTFSLIKEASKGFLLQALSLWYCRHLFFTIFLPLWFLERIAANFPVVGASGMHFFEFRL